MQSQIGEGIINRNKRHTWRKIIMGGSIADSGTKKPVEKAVQGCEVTKQDSPYIVASLACSMAFLVYGASVAALGAALPSMAERFNTSTAHLGVMFTARGIGYCVGTLGSAYVINLPNVTLSKEMMTCIAMAISGILQIIEISPYVHLMVILVCLVIQGLQFGVIDTMANGVLPEMWGKRVQPWMQALHSCFGIGAMIGPALVGGFGFETAYIMICFLSFMPLMCLLSFYGLQVVSCSYLSNLLFQKHPDHEPIRFQLEDDERDVEYNDQHQQQQQRQLSDEIADLSRNHDVSNSGEDTEMEVVAPMYLRIIASLFFFIYVGSETGFAGWIPTYALNAGITTSYAKAAYLSATFWAALTVGRVVAIPMAVYFSSTFMIRLQLSLSVFSTFLSLFIMQNYPSAVFISAFVGFALSSMFPVMMTIVGEYGFKMDANITTMMIVGATLGEAMLPVGIGGLMGVFGPYAMLTTVFVACWCLVAIYLSVHYISLAIVPQLRSGHIQLTEFSEHNSRHPLTNHHHRDGDSDEEESSNQLDLSDYNPMIDSLDESDLVTIDFSTHDDQ